MKKGIVISARGRDTFTPSQVQRLEDCMRTTFMERLHAFSDDEFVETVRDYPLVALTRKCIKNLAESLLFRLNRLEGLALFSTGYEWVATDYLETRNIPVCYLPGYSTVTVAEHTIAMLLTLSRRIHLSHDFTRGLLPAGVSLRGFEIRGKRAGIIGMGRIGRETARLLQAFGAAVAYCDPRDPDVPYARKPLATVLAESDILIVTASKTRGAAPLLGRPEIAKMKPGIVIVNSARADHVDPRAVLWGIGAKIICGYAVDDRLDCFKGPLPFDHGRILQTAHTAWYSAEAIGRGLEEWVENIVALAAGNPQNVVNGRCGTS